MKRTLLLIFAAFALMIGSFIWFVTTWDASAEEPVSMTQPIHIGATT
ncbi:hypothetical protein OAN307_c06190 [Octadecabacter antarcticus 307]|uniref:Uncharacterized protein n=1 Tax=Octadecabacter antarcticus 307 TaxID=391626 RepID=M9R7Q2_9RHOB|nr:hypothetical protein [Octadecabacter antarcticus]AGI66346.1 hypothetical protein OAN307_c06190 [Octadecabacter antarcticus 307]